MVPTDLNEVIKNYLDSPGFVKLSESKSKVEMKLEIDENAGSIQGSSAHLAKVVMNLVVNALHAVKAHNGCMKYSMIFLKEKELLSNSIFLRSLL